MITVKPAVRVGDRMWPSMDTGDMEWVLRFGPPDTVLRLRFQLAAIAGAYRELASKPEAKRNPIIKQLREAAEWPS